MMQRRKHEEDKGAPKWMVTFSDLFMLVLVFFILLFSMSQIDLVKFKAVAESFKQVNFLDYHPSAVPFEHPTDFSVETETTNNQKEETVSMDAAESEKKLQELLSEVQDFLEANDLEDVVVANRTERGIVLVLEEKCFLRQRKQEFFPLLILSLIR